MERQPDHGRIVAPVPRLILRPAQQLRRLGDVGGDAPGLIAGKQIGGRATAGITLEIYLGERVLVLVADNETGVG